MLQFGSGCMFDMNGIELLVNTEGVWMHACLVGARHRHMRTTCTYLRGRLQDVADDRQQGGHEEGRAAAELRCLMDV